jgi:hypothetical protein
MLVRMFRHISSITFVLALAVASAAQTPNPVEVAPGVTLPAEGMVFGLDQKDGGPALQQIHASEIHYNPRAGSNTLRSVIYARSHHTIEVIGLQSETIFTSTKAVFYVHLLEDNPEIQRKRIHLLWLTPTDTTRVAIDMGANYFGGHHQRNIDEVPADITSISGTNWVKITPQAPLLPGEFAIAFLPEDPSLFPDVVYDFSVPGIRGGADPNTPKSDEKK